VDVSRVSLARWPIDIGYIWDTHQCAHEPCVAQGQRRSNSRVADTQVRVRAGPPKMPPSLDVSRGRPGRYATRPFSFLSLVVVLVAQLSRWERLRTTRRGAPGHRAVRQRNFETGPIGPCRQRRQRHRVVEHARFDLREQSFPRVSHNGVYAEHPRPRLAGSQVRAPRRVAAALRRVLRRDRGGGTAEDSDATVPQPSSEEPVDE
jgi:hypothetical protein